MVCIGERHFAPEKPHMWFFQVPVGPDGNLTSDGTYTYAWNDENRLIQQLKANTEKIEYTYDGIGRMRIKKSYAWTGTAWQLGSELRFAYDNNCIIAELDGSDSVIRSYVWGLDIDGGLGTAGGVGGLLAFTTLNPEPETLYPAYDGNGNITAIADAGTGNVTYTCEYSPFGEVVSKTGSSDCPFGFSTQYTAHGLVHYLYRKYSPEFGRWLSRDPIGDEGFFRQLIKLSNISTKEYVKLLADGQLPPYLFVQNNPINKEDKLGLGNIVPWEQVNWGTTSTMDWKGKFLAWSEDFLKKSNIEGQPCNKPSAKITETKVIFVDGYNLGFTVKNSIKQTDAVDLKFIWYTCYRNSGAGAVPDTLNKNPLTVAALNTGMSGGPYIFGIKLSFYSCEDGCYKRFTTSANISVSEGFFEWGEDK